MLCGLFEFIIWMNPKKWTHFFNEKSGSLLYHRKFKYFLPISFSFTNKKFFLINLKLETWNLNLKLTCNGLFQKKFTPPRRKARFFDPPSTWISKTAWAPLHSGFPSLKTPPPIWISIKLLDTVILLYIQCGRIL